MIDVNRNQSFSVSSVRKIVFMQYLLFTQVEIIEKKQKKVYKNYQKFKCDIKNCKLQKEMFYVLLVQRK